MGRERFKQIEADKRIGKEIDKWIDRYVDGSR